VKIELLKGGVISRTVVADTATGAEGAGTLSWTIPADQDPGTDYRIRVAAIGGTPSDTSDADFSILAAESPTVTVVEPAAGSSWEAGSSRTVSWRYTGAVGDNLGIKLMRSGVEIATIAAAAPAGTGGAGSFAWAIPAGLAPGTTYRVSVESVSVPAARGSSGEFSITAPAPVEFLALAAPNGGEIVRPGERTTVEWRYRGIVGSTVRIDLLKAGTAILAVADGIPTGAGRYDWTVPAGTAAGTDYRVRISSREVPAFSDVSDGFFTVSAGGIDVTAPAAGDTWHPDTVRTIRWTHAAQGYNYIRIFVSDGASQFPLAGPIPIGAGGTGSWQWRIPSSAPVGGTFRIRVASTVDPAMAGESGAFSIAAPTIAVLSPAAGETWRHGERRTVSWTFTGGDDDYVRVELAGAAGTTPVARSVPIGRAGSGSFAWTVPPGCAPGSGYRIRVVSLNRPGLAGESGTFSVAGR